MFYAQAVSKRIGITSPFMCQKRVFLSIEYELEVPPTIQHEIFGSDGTHLFIVKLYG